MPMRIFVLFTAGRESTGMTLQGPAAWVCLQTIAKITDCHVEIFHQDILGADLGIPSHDEAA